MMWMNRPVLVGVVSPGSLGDHHPDCDGGETAAAQQLKVGRAPQGDVDAVGPVPQLVEREGGNAAQSESEESHRRPGNDQALVLDAGVALSSEANVTAIAAAYIRPPRPNRIMVCDGFSKQFVTPQVDVPGNVPVKAHRGHQQDQ